VDNPNAVIDERCLLVTDTLKTLQDLATYHRRVCGIPVLAITGTNGKTTTKELTAAVLSEAHPVLFTQGNLNNHIGVPLTLLQLTAEHRLAIIEMGANHPGEINELCQIADPDYGLITNVGIAHIEGFGSFEGVMRAKGELYEYLRAKNGKVFINQDNPFLLSMASNICQLTYGTKPGYSIWGEVLSCAPFLTLRWHIDSKQSSYEVSTRLIGSYNLENVLAAICIGHYFGVNPEQINHALASYVPSNNRSQWQQTAKNKLIIDAYNANPSSMKEALSNFRFSRRPKKWLSSAV
jgi:UDP-N-acetylmuramoyl-tripeptide--D-alanyl-D-alanine ligase